VNNKIDIDLPEAKRHRQGNHEKVVCNFLNMVVKRGNS